jgi:hypothetical protein
MTKEELYDYALNALAVPSGAVDEAAFGLPSKYIPGVQKLKQDYPIATTVGQVGSYMIPGTGVVGGAGKIAKMLGMLKKGNIAAKEARPAIQFLSKLIKNAGVGAVESGGQVAIRKGFGTSDGGSVSDAAESGAKLGAGLAIASPVLGAIAKKAYFDPRIVNERFKRSKDAAQELMDRGVWGGEGTFRNYANQAKDQFNKYAGKYQKGVASEPVKIEDLLEEFAKRSEAEAATGGAVKQFKKVGEGATERLGDAPLMGEADSYRKLIHQKLAELEPAKRSNAINPGSDVSKVMARDASLGAMKSSIDKAEEKIIGQKYGQEGLDALGLAKKEYGIRRELGRSLDKGKSPNVIIPSIVGGAGAGAAAAAGNPTAAMLALGATGGLAAARTLPVRTGTGVFLNKLSKSSSKSPARFMEYMRRKEIDEPKQSSLPNELNDILNAKADKKAKGLPTELQDILESK